MIIEPGRKPTPPGEWETDSDGKRFRFDGRCIEYEPTILTSSGTLTRRQLEDMQARERSKPAPVPKFPSSSKTCPFKDGISSLCTEDDCALYTPEGCAMKCPHPATGKKCPYKRVNCNHDCALRGK